MKDDDFRPELSGVSGSIQLDPGPFFPRQLPERESRPPGPFRQIFVAEDLGLRFDVRCLEKRVTALECSIRVNSVPINTLGSDKWEIKQPPLNVAVEQRDQDDFIACLYDVDLYGYGDTIPEALDDLKEVIINQFEFLLEQEGKVELGGMPKRQLEFLGKVLVRINA